MINWGTACKGKISEIKEDSPDFLLTVKDENFFGGIFQDRRICFTHSLSLFACSFQLLLRSSPEALQLSAPSSRMHQETKRMCDLRKEPVQTSLL